MRQYAATAFVLLIPGLVLAAGSCGDGHATISGPDPGASTGGQAADASAGAAGQAGAAAGAGGSSGAGGDAGTAGSAAVGGQAGEAGGGSAGSAGSAGAAGAEPTAGSAGSAGAAGLADAGPATPCSNSAACAAGELCSNIQFGGNLAQAFCQPEHASGTSTGTGCLGSSECKSLLCPSWLLICTEVCSSDADCTGVGAAECIDVAEAGGAVVQACAGGCSRPSDCSGGSTCVIATDSKQDHHPFTCAVPGGPDLTGADCSGANHCASSVCLTNTLNGQPVESICTQPCVTGADCPASFSACVEVQMPRPSGNGTHTIRVCNRP